MDSLKYISFIPTHFLFLFLGNGAANFIQAKVGPVSHHPLRLPRVFTKDADGQRAAAQPPGAV